MKIKIEKNRSLTIDGENNTTIQSQNHQDAFLKKDVNGKYKSDFISVVDHEGNDVEFKITNSNFVGSHSNPFEFKFGDRIVINNNPYKFIGIQDNKNIFWDENRSCIAIANIE